MSVWNASKALYGAEILRKQMPAAVSDADRQRAWEEGIVDYTGRDSWEIYKNGLKRYQWRKDKLRSYRQQHDPTTSEKARKTLFSVRTIFPNSRNVRLALENRLSHLTAALSTRFSTKNTF
ncbi:Glycogenin-2 [Trichinella pseudospiralis]